MSATERFSNHSTTVDWTRGDHYHNSFLIPPDPTVEKIIENSAAGDLPDIAVSAAQGKLLNLIAQSIRAKRILEVGTLGAYSTVWLARALPDDGDLVTLELEEKHVKVARENLALADLSSKVQVIQGLAAESLAKLSADHPFDLVFIDADKPNNTIYFSEAKRLVRAGGVIIVDNVVRDGKVANPDYTDERVEGVRALLRAIKVDNDIEATTISTVGEKGYDGFIYAIRK